MRRTHALERRNTPVRLVVMTASQSSGFMRSSSESRVTAALLTRIVGSSEAASSSPIKVSTEAAFPASSTAPRPLHPCDASVAPKRAAPSALVAVRSEEHTSELQSPDHLVCRLLLEKKKKKTTAATTTQ